jgi:TIR domain-containing protein
MDKIFVSYSRADLELVKGLVQELELLGHEAWFDQTLTGGQHWWDTILAEIRSCELFVCTLSADSMNSQACKLELGYALRLGKPVLPLLVSKNVTIDALPRYLSELQIVDYTLQDRFKALTLSLRNRPRAPALPQPLPEPPSVPLSYLSTMREKIESPAELDLTQQRTLVFDLRDDYRDGHSAKEICDLLNLLKKRTDLRAKVSKDIDDVLDEVARKQRPSSDIKLLPEPARPSEGVRDETPQGASKPIGPERPLENDHDARWTEGEEEETRQFQVEDAVEECKIIVERILHSGEGWTFEMDDANCFVVELDRSGKTPCLKATATLRDSLGGAKQKGLRALGWDIQTDSLIKGAIGSVALYATSGLATFALLSPSVRKMILTFGASRSWTVPKGKKDTAARAAAEFALAIQKMADVTTVVVKRKQPDSTAWSQPEMPARQEA